MAEGGVSSYLVAYNTPPRLQLIPERESRDALWQGNLARVAAFKTPAPTPAPTPAAMGSPADRLRGESAARGGRIGACERRTKETTITAWVNLDGTGDSAIGTG